MIWASRGAAFAAVSVLLAAPALAQATSGLTVVFPSSGYQTTSDRIFFIGTAPAGTPVTLNGKALTDRSPAGHFAPTLPLKLGENTFRLVAGGQTRVIVVKRLPAAPPAPSGLAFGAGSLAPHSETMRSPGERLTFSAIAPPGATVTVLWAGRRVPLAPQPPRFTLPDNKAGLIARNQPRREGPGVRHEGAAVATGPVPATSPVFELTLNGRMLRQVGPARVGVLDPAALAVVQVSADEGVTRTGPSTDYSRLTPLPKGARAAVTATEGEWLRLSHGRWLKRAETTALPGAVPPETLVKSLRLDVGAHWSHLVVPLEQAVPAEITPIPGGVAVDLHHAVAQTDLYLANDGPLVGRVDFAQVAPDRLRYSLDLKGDQRWGHKLRYDGTTLVASFRHPPVLQSGRSPLSGRRVVLDAGHGGAEDPGTTGPTGLSEKDLTLPVTRLVRDELVKRGAAVTLTRDADVYVDLKDRVGLIRKLEPDFALSLHYNALPDAGDARHTQGIGAFWFDPASHGLARALHTGLTTRLERPSYGVFWDNLAMTRPTVCPSVLLEIGFLTHPEEFEWVTDPAAQQRLAVAIADSLEAWLLSAAGSQAR